MRLQGADHGDPARLADKTQRKPAPLGLRASPHQRPAGPRRTLLATPVPLFTLGCCVPPCASLPYSAHQRCDAPAVTTRRARTHGDAQRRSPPPAGSPSRTQLQRPPCLTSCAHLSPTVCAGALHTASTRPPETPTPHLRHPCLCLLRTTRVITPDLSYVLVRSYCVW